MEKIAFLFSGQGCQNTGMGKKLYDNSKEAGFIFKTLDLIRSGTSEQCFTADKETLSLTVNTQPCLFSVEMAAAAALWESGIKPRAVAGFSLGELPALCFSGVFTLEEAFALTVVRGKYMNEAAERSGGVMAAVLGLEFPLVEALCREYNNRQNEWNQDDVMRSRKLFGVVDYSVDTKQDFPDRAYPVNYNCPGQLVISGSEKAVDEVCEQAKKSGGRIKRLLVSGAFHSPYMDSAARRLYDYMYDLPIKRPRIPVYSNVTGLPYKSHIKSQLAKQIVSPVRWTDTIENMIKKGINTFIEVGVGTTLCNLVKRINKDVIAKSYEEYLSYM